MKWQEIHPFPARSDEQMKVLEREVDQLREQVTKDHQELRALQERSKDRRLTASQRASFMEALSKGEKGEIEVAFVSGNSEAERFAYDIALALQDSGWKVTSMVSAMFVSDTPVGILVVVKDPQMPSVQTLLSVLPQVTPKIQLKINSNLDRPIKLDVGNKP